MKLRYYAGPDVLADHRRTLELLASVAETHGVPVEVVHIESGLPLDDYRGPVVERSLEDAWSDFTYNSTFADGVGAPASQYYDDREDIVGNVAVVVDDEVVWATQFWGSHHGWGPVDPERTAIGFLELVADDGVDALVDRVPLDDWTPDLDAPNDDVATDGNGADVDEPARDEIREICTTQSFERGRRYAESGRVRDVTVSGSEVRASVRGTHDYTTRVDLAADDFFGRCSCPYDGAGDCKHVVAVLLTVADRFEEFFGDQSSTGTSTSDVEAALANADTETMREFLDDVLTEHPEFRERFLATVGDAPEKRTGDYKREIERDFDRAAGPHGLVEYGTRIDFTEYYDIATAHEKTGNYTQAAHVYRALAETIQENLERTEDESGYYIDHVARAVEADVACVQQQQDGLDRDDRRDYIDDLVDQYVDAEFGTVSESYDDALRTLCTATADYEYLRSRLEPHIEAQTPVEVGTVEDGSPAVASTAGESEDATLTDPTPRLNVEWFTGDALDGDVETLSDGPLDVRDFVGETLAERLAEHAPTRHASGGETGEPPTTGVRLDSTDRRLLSTYLWVLDELDAVETREAVLADVYIESAAFFREYVDLLVESDAPERARAVVEDGLDHHTHSPEAYRVATDFYRECDAERYRDLLQTRFVRFEDWDAYDELKAACPDEEWQSVSHAIRSQLGRLDTTQLIDLYLHEGEREKALETVLDSEDLDVLQAYRADVADLDSEGYFETYRNVLEPYLAAETGRPHYRTVIDHLEEMAALGLDERFEDFLVHLREKHANRPAFHDELNKANFDVGSTSPSS